MLALRRLVDTDAPWRGGCIARVDRQNKKQKRKNEIGLTSTHESRINRTALVVLHCNARYNQVDISKLIVDAEEARRIEEAAEAQRLLDAENGGKDKRPGSKGRK